MKILFSFILVLFLLACSKDDTKQKEDLTSPTDGQSFAFGDTIHFIGHYRSPVLEFNTGYLRVRNVTADSMLFDRVVNSDFDETWVHQFDTKTVLDVKFSVLYEDAKSESLLRQVQITCVK